MQGAATELKTIFANALRPDIKMSVSEWSDEYRYLPSSSAKEPGRMRISRTPYMKEPLDELSSMSRTEIVTMMKAAQIGATEAGNSWVGSIIHHTPGPMLIVQPNGEAVSRFSKQRLDPMIETCPALRERVPEKNSKDGGHSIKEKIFPGGAIFLVGAHAPAGLRSTPARYLFMDEISNYEADVGGEGDPVELARARTTTYGRHRKIFQCSTPKIKGFCRIETEFKKSDQRYYHVPCPECGDLSAIYFNTKPGSFARKKLKWRTKDGKHLPKTAHLICEHCGCKIDEIKKTWMFAEENGAKWIPTAEGEDAHKGYHISGLYASYGLGISWAEIVQKFLSAKKRSDRGDVSQLKAFNNNVLGETWVDLGTEVESSHLYKRREPLPEGVLVPNGGVYLTAGVDVQDSPGRIELTVYAWGLFEEAWAIEHKVFWGTPSNKNDIVWEKLDDYIFHNSFKHESGKELKVSYVGVDTGYATDSVYHYIKTRQHRGFIGLKGDSGNPSAPIVKPARKSRTGRDRRPINLFMVGTFEAKDILFKRLQLNKAQEGETSPGYIHFPERECFDENYFDQFAAERLQVDMTPRGFKRHFVQVEKRNEAIDCFVYAYAALHIGQPQLKREYEKVHGDSEVEIEDPRPIERPAVSHNRNRRPTRPKRGGYMNNY